MLDIWNPWHGCKKCSEGCENCYMYFLDAQRGKNGADIYRTKAGFNYPLSKDRSGHYKIKSGEQLRVCMTSDFFLEEADVWRDEAWNIIRQRPDVVFFLLTKRPDRKFGEAAVLLTEDDDIVAVRQVCERILPRYWRPRETVHVDHIPLTPTGKPARAEAMKLLNDLIAKNECC